MEQQQRHKENGDGKNQSQHCEKGTLKRGGSSIKNHRGGKRKQEVVAYSGAGGGGGRQQFLFSVCVYT